ncbi:MAG: metallophosphoesterase [Planctomycetales bacterium]|nr:metallophosphoesterase [Planctomycetales bacterium]
MIKTECLRSDSLHSETLCAETLWSVSGRATDDYADGPKRVGRRAVLKGGMLVLAGAGVSQSTLSADDSTAGADAGTLRIGLVTDLHYADKPPAGSRHYRETPDKLAEAADRFGQSPPAFIVELGDLIDAADSVATEQGYLRTINESFSAICDDRHYVLGNHCVDTLQKEEFLGAVGQPRSYYSFDRGGFHFVVLDSCFRSDGQPYGRKNFKWTDANLPPEELDWLKSDLSVTQKKTIVFAHQRLDVQNNHGVKNNEDVREILQSSGKVLAVFQGHSHQNDLKDINGIHYCTLVAMVEGSGKENNGYSLMEIDPDGTIRLDGFRNQADYRWPIDA